MNKAAMRIRPPNVLVSVEPEDGESEIGTQIESSCSSNATMDDIPGPGRVLDKAYQHFGRKLEKSANKLAARFSYINPPPDEILYHFLQDYQDSPSIFSVRSYSMEYTIKRISEHLHGPTEVVGLQSLVRQAQSVNRATRIPANCY